MSATKAFSALVVSCALCGCTESALGEWVEIGRTQPDNSPFYMHSQLKTFENDSRLAVVTSRFHFENPTSDATGKSYRTVISTLLLNCIGNEVSEIVRLAFEGADATGEKHVITDRTPEEAKLMLAPINDPAIRALHSIACQKIAKAQRET